jgi:hypothetical protein
MNDFFQGIGVTVMPASTHRPPRGWISLAEGRERDGALYPMVQQHGD